MKYWIAVALQVLGVQFILLKLWDLAVTFGFIVYG